MERAMTLCFVLPLLMSLEMCTMDFVNQECVRLYKFCTHYTLCLYNVFVPAEQENSFKTLPAELIVDILAKAIDHFTLKKYYGLKQALKYLICMRRVDKRFYFLLNNQIIARTLCGTHADFIVKRPRTDFLTFVPLPVFAPTRCCTFGACPSDISMGYCKPEETLEQWARRKRRKDCIEIILFCYNNKSLM